MFFFSFCVPNFFLKKWFDVTMKKCAKLIYNGSDRNEQICVFCNAFRSKPYQNYN